MKKQKEVENVSKSATDILTVISLALKRRGELATLYTRLESDTRSMNYRLQEYNDSKLDLDNFRTPISPGIRSRLENTEEEQLLSKKVKEALTALENAKLTVANTQNEIDQRRKEYGDDTMEVSEQDLTAFQDEVAREKGNVQRIRNAIAEQEGIITKATPDEIDLSPLESRREQLLAEIALGEATAVQLSTIEEELSGQKANAERAKEEAGKVITPAMATIAGLRQKLQQAEESLAILLADGRILLATFFESEAEREGQRYVQAVKDVAQRFKRIVALDELMKRYSPAVPRVSLLHQNWEEMLIPAFRLDACKEGDAAGRFGEVMFSPLYHCLEEEADAQQELEKVRGVVNLIG